MNVVVVVVVSGSCGECNGVWLQYLEELCVMNQMW